MTVTGSDTTMLDNANNANQKHDSTPVDEAGHIATPGSDADGRPDSDQGYVDQENDQVRKARREAAGLRKRLRETETERDQLRSQLDASHHDIVAMVAAGAGLPDPGLLAAAGHDTNSFFTEDGRVDSEKVSDACRATMRQYRIGRPPAPNYQQGTGGGHPGESSSDRWAGAFAPPKA